jgi:glycosyl transferase, family 25
MWVENVIHGGCLEVRGYIINLDAASDRWSFINTVFAKTQITLCRVPAIDGNTLRLPHKDYSESRYRWFHGRETNTLEIGCYLSHVKALETFLSTDEEFAIIGEDDIVMSQDLEAVLARALHYSRFWNVLRLSGLSQGRPIKAMKLVGEYHLGVNLGRVKGSGAYVVDRTAARVLASRLKPMWLPYDHAIDREWFHGLRAKCIVPFPISQSERRFPSIIQRNAKSKLSSSRRWRSTYPYQVFNESTRWVFRLGHYICLQALLRSSRNQPGDSWANEIGGD